MIEHRLIGRMLALVRLELEGVRRGRPLNPGFVQAAVDFIRVYADRVHHGKEEDLLFRELARKSLTPPDRAAMDELVREHAWARKRAGELAGASERLAGGGSGAADDIAKALLDLVEFYPKHIEREDRRFFPAATAYLSEQEQQAMLREFADFDRGLIHEIYRGLVASLEMARLPGQEPESD
ncbi:MAG TPA: hemerythrin domain-containing protein [Planctomycetota bacterium]|nr:hemerythrin domain-containing protein [Planctomycetota bacterium]